MRAGGRLAAVAAQYAAFLAKFDAQAEDGRLDKAKCVALATECILKVRLPDAGWLRGLKVKGRGSR